MGSVGGGLPKLLRLRLLLSERPMRVHVSVKRICVNLKKEREVVKDMEKSARFLNGKKCTFPTEKSARFLPFAIDSVIFLNSGERPEILENTHGGVIFLD